MRFLRPSRILLSAGQSQGQRKPAARAGRADRAKLLVVVAETGEGVVNDRFTAIGTGQAVRSVSVRTLVSGQIDRIPVQPGGRVERGDVIIHLDASEEELAVERARLTVDDAQARVARLESLVASRAASSVEADQARNTYDTAAVSRLRQAELELARRTVTAPISGSLGILSVNAGDYVTSQTEIASIDDRSEILIEFYRARTLRFGNEGGKAGRRDRHLASGRDILGRDLGGRQPRRRSKPHLAGACADRQSR
jgi:multidrug efflux pump subunit AcrA (membrane-fusion protein)